MGKIGTDLKLMLWKLSRKPSIVAGNVVRLRICVRNMGVCILYLPNSHPLLNPIEHLWRYLKMKWRHGAVDMKNEKALFDSITNGMDADWSGEELQKHLKKWFVLVDRYALFFANCKKRRSSSF
jgi:transposase